MLKACGNYLWIADSGVPGPSLAISFGVHGNERSPIVAGEQLRARFEAGDLAVRRGKLLLIHANPKASEQDQRWSEGGVDLNRCFHADTLAAAPKLYEEERAQEIVPALEQAGSEVLVDFHCTVEPGQRFLMQHPSVEDAAHARVYGLLRAEILLADPGLTFGGVSLDEVMSTRGRVGICYETGWIQDPENSPEFVLGEMTNLLAGLGLFGDRDAQRYEGKRRLELEGRILCEADGFRWCEGIGQNLQSLSAGTQLGTYGDGREVRLENDATLIFPKKRPELMQVGKPLVLLARSVS